MNMSTRATQKHAVSLEHRRGRLAAVGGITVLLAVAGIGVAVCAWRSDDASSPQVSATQASAVGTALPVVDVHKSATCTCCSKWVDHLREAGFTVRTTNTDDLANVKTSHGVPRQVESCHTAFVDGYVIEGHVPAADIRRLLTERPAIAGLAVGGMPIGSPGMEVSGASPQPYDVMAFDTGAGTRVFATHR
jgi:hypothetical protein